MNYNFATGYGVKGRDSAPWAVNQSAQPSLSHCSGERKTLRSAAVGRHFRSLRTLVRAVVTKQTFTFFGYFLYNRLNRLPMSRFNNNRGGLGMNHFQPRRGGPGGPMRGGGLMGHQQFRNHPFQNQNQNRRGPNNHFNKPPNQGPQTTPQKQQNQSTPIIPPPSPGPALTMKGPMQQQQEQKPAEEQQKPATPAPQPKIQSPLPKPNMTSPQPNQANKNQNQQLKSPPGNTNGQQPQQQRQPPQPSPKSGLQQGPKIGPLQGQRTGPHQGQKAGLPRGPKTGSPAIKQEPTDASDEEQNKVCLMFAAHFLLIMAANATVS